jgi:spore germination protein KB
MDNRPSVKQKGGERVKEDKGEKLGTRELIGIILILLIIKSTDTTPTLMFKSGYSAGWLIPIISGAMVLVPLLCTLSFLKAYRDKGFIEVVFHLYGKYIGTVIGLALFYIIFAALVVNTRSYIDIMSTVFYPKTPVSVLYSVLLISSLYIAYLGIHAIGRTAWIVTPTLQIVVFLLIFLAEKRINPYFIFPIAGPGIFEIIKSSAMNTAIWGDILYLSIIFPMVRSHKEFKMANLIGYSVSVIEFTVFMIVYVVTFGYPSISYLNYPLQELAKYARFGRYFTNPQAVFLGFWIISAILRFSTQIYFSAVTISHTLKIKDHKPLLFPISASAMALGMLPENSITNVLLIRRELFDWTWPLVLILPVSLWVTARLKEEI